MDTSSAKPIVGIVCCALSALLIAGLMTFAGPCVHEDGTVGTCGWAARATLAVAVVSLILSLVRIFELDEGERRGLDVGILSTSILSAVMPGPIIDLCMVTTMRCHTLMGPFVRVVAGVSAVVAAVDLVRRLLAIRRR